MKVARSNVNDAGGMRVTRFGVRADGTHCAEVMLAELVGHPRVWRDTDSEITVRIEPGPRQLEKIIAALDAGDIDFGDICQETIGHGEHGGFAIIDYV